MKLAVCSVLALALSLPVQAQWPPRELNPGETLLEEIAVVTRSEEDLTTPDDSKASQEKAITCSISFSPSLISNSQQSFYSTSYGGTGCVKGKLVETVTWNWASIISYYGEFQIQKKQLEISSGCLASSGHVVSSPTGTGIKGPTKVSFELRDWPGNNLICSATTTLTVN